MKRHVQTTGIRNWAGDDLIELQSESLKVLDEFFGHFGPCIISGCEIEGNEIKPGIVGLFGYDHEEEETYKVVPFEGAEVDAFPVYLSLNYETGERIYGDMQTKPIFQSYYAELSTTPPEGEYFTIKETNNHLFVDAIQDPDHRFLTDEQVDKLTGIFHDDGSYLFIGTDITLEATDGDIVIKATDDIEVHCKDLKVSVADNIEIEAENNISVKAKNGNTTITANKTTSLTGGKSSATINENIDGEAEKSINLKAGDGEVNITASDSMNLSSKNLNAEAAETVDIQGGTSSVTINEDVEVQADKDFTLNAQTGNSTITVSKTASMVGSDASITLNDDAAIKAGKNVSVQATNGKTDISASDALNLTATTVNATGSTATTIKGGTSSATLNSNVNIQASKDATINAQTGDATITAKNNTTISGSDSTITINDNIEEEAEKDIVLTARTGKVKVSAKNEVEVNAGDLNLSVDEDINLKAGKNIILEAQDGKTEVTASDEILLNGATSNVTLNDSATVEANKDLSLQAKNGKADLSAKDAVNITGTTVNATGGTTTTIKGGTSSAILNSDVSIHANKDATINAQTGDATITAKNNTRITGSDSTITINDNIEGEAEKDIILTARTGKVNVNAKNEVEVNASDLNLSVDEDINLKAGKNIALEALSGKTEVKASDEILLNGATSSATINDSVTVEANKDLSLQAKNGKADLAAKDAVNITGTTVNATGSTTTTIKGGTSSTTLNNNVNVQANKDLILNAKTGNADITANATTTLTGGNSTVTINENVTTEAEKAVNIQAKSGKADITASDAVNLTGATINATGNTATTIKGGTSSATLNSNVDIQADKNLTLNAKAGNAEIIASTTSSITGGNSDITVNENIIAEAEKDITLKANGGKVNITANNEVEINASDLNLSVNEDINLEAEKNIHLKANTGEATLTASENVSLKGKNLNATGSTATTIKGGSSTATLNSNIDLQANNNVTIDAKAGNADITAKDTTSLTGGNSGITINEDIKAEANKDIVIKANSGKADLTASDVVNLSGKTLNATGTDATTIKGGNSTATLNTNVDIQANNNFTVNAKTGNVTITAENIILENDTTINGQLFYTGVKLTENDDIDTLFTPGIYSFMQGTEVQGTFPENGYTQISASTAIHIIPLYSNAVYQILYNNGYTWIRRLSSNTLYNWFRVADNATFAKYLPLAGGKMSGNISLEGNALYFGGMNGTVKAEWKDQELYIGGAQNKGITLENTYNGADINLNTTTGKVLYNNEEVAIVNQLKTDSFEGTRLTTADNIDTLTIPGLYYINAGDYNEEATYPFGLSTSGSSVIQIYKTNSSNSIYQSIWHNRKIYLRTIDNNNNLTNWMNVTNSVNISTNEYNIDDINIEGSYYAAGGWETQGTFPEGVTITAFNLEVKRIGGGHYLHTLHIFTGNSVSYKYQRYLNLDGEKLSEWVRDVIESTSGTVAISGSLYTNGKTGSTDGNSGVALGTSGVHITGSTPNIYFYHNNSTTTTNRLYESASGTLRTTGNFITDGTLNPVRGINTGNSADLTLTGANIAIAAANGIATYNGNELATVDQVTTGIVTQLTASDNIDTLYIPGQYTIPTGGSVAGTYPEGFSTTSLSNLIVHRNNNAIHQTLYNNGNIWVRRINSSTPTLYEWAKLNENAININSSSYDIDKLFSEGNYYGAGTLLTEGVFPDISFDGFSLQVVRMGGSTYLQTMYCVHNGSSTVYQFTRTINSGSGIVNAWVHLQRYSYNDILTLENDTINLTTKDNINLTTRNGIVNYNGNEVATKNQISNLPELETRLKTNTTLTTGKYYLIGEATAQHATYTSLVTAGVNNINPPIYAISAFSYSNRVPYVQKLTTFRGTTDQVEFYYRYTDELIQLYVKTDSTSVNFGQTVIQYRNFIPKFEATTVDESELTLIVITDNTSLYLPVKGGTISGNLNITGSLTHNSTTLSANSNIDEIITGGNYKWNANVNVQGTLPTSGYTTTASTAITVIPLSSTAAYQVMYNNGYSWIRRITTNGTIYAWFRVADAASLSNYLPLSGGTVTGALTVNGRFKWTSTNINASSWNIDEIIEEGEYYTSGGYTTSGTFPEVTPTLQAFHFRVERLAGGYYLHTLSTFTGGSVGPRIFIRWLQITDGEIVKVTTWSEVTNNSLSDSYLPLSGGTMTGAINLNNNYVAFGNSKDNSIYYDTSEGTVIQTNVSQGLTVRNTGGGDVNITTNTGKATYNGKEIATINDLPSLPSALENALNTTNGIVAGEISVINSYDEQIGLEFTGYKENDPTGDKFEIIIPSASYTSAGVMPTSHYKIIEGIIDDGQVMNRLSLHHEDDRIVFNGGCTNANGQNDQTISFGLWGATNTTAGVLTAKQFPAVDALSKGEITNSSTLNISANDLKLEGKDTLSLLTKSDGIRPTWNGKEIATLEDTLGIEDNTGIIWVNCHYTGTEERGTIDAPYKTLTQALQNTEGTELREFKVCSGEYDEDINLEGTPKFITISSFSENNPSSLAPNGTYLKKLDIDATYNRYNILIKGITFTEESFLSAVAVDIENCYFFNNLTIKEGESINLNHCYFGQKIIMEGGLVTLTSSSFNPSQGNIKGIYIKEGDLTLNNCRNLYLNHEGGSVTSKDSWFTPTSSSDTSSITSSAPQSNSNKLLLYGGGIYSTSGNHGRITKTGNCAYSISNFIYDVTDKSTLPGQEIPIGLKGNQIYIPQSFSNYTKSSSKLTGHLEGIDSKLGEITESLEEVSVEDNSGIIWVNCNYTGTEEKGTIDAPYKTMTKALENIETKEEVEELDDLQIIEIKVAPGFYNEDIEIVEDKYSAILITGQTGDCGIYLPLATTFKNLKLDGINLVAIRGVGFSEQASIGISMVDMESCAFIGGLSVINSELAVFYNCTYSYFAGIKESNVYMKSCIPFMEIVPILILDGYVTLENCNGLCLYHDGGMVMSYDSWFTSPSTSDSKALHSNAEAAWNNGLFLYGGGVSEGLFTKTGTCKYTISNFIYDVNDTTTFPGEEIPIGLKGNQVYIPQTFSNYTKSSSKLTGHLEGINTKLGNLSRTVTNSNAGLAPSTWYNKLNNFVNSNLSVSNSIIKSTHTDGISLLADNIRLANDTTVEGTIFTGNSSAMTLGSTTSTNNIQGSTTNIKTTSTNISGTTFSVDSSALVCSSSSIYLTGLPDSTTTPGHIAVISERQPYNLTKQPLADFVSNLNIPVTTRKVASYQSADSYIEDSEQVINIFVTNNEIRITNSQNRDLLCYSTITEGRDVSTTSTTSRVHVLEAANPRVIISSSYNYRKAEFYILDMTSRKKAYNASIYKCSSYNFFSLEEIPY